MVLNLCSVKRKFQCPISQLIKKILKNLVTEAFASVSNIRYIIEYQWLFNI